MPIVIVNDVEVEAEEGETLLDVARREAAHIGFLCGGMGICMACVCRVQEGAEYLTPPNDIEVRGVAKPWIDSGHRVACQAKIAGPGPIRILSRPEELWRQLQGVLRAEDGNSAGKSFLDFGMNFMSISLQQWLSFPMSTINAVYQATKARPMPDEINRLVTDTRRVVSRMTERDEDEEAEEAEAQAEGDKKQPVQEQQSERSAAVKAQQQEKKKSSPRQQGTSTQDNDTEQDKKGKTDKSRTQSASQLKDW
jgi:ferredoxin